MSRSSRGPKGIARSSSRQTGEGLRAQTRRLATIFPTSFLMSSKPRLMPYIALSKTISTSRRTCYCQESTSSEHFHFEPSIKKKKSLRKLTIHLLRKQIHASPAHARETPTNTPSFLFSLSLALSDWQPKDLAENQIGRLRETNS